MDAEQQDAEFHRVELRYRAIRESTDGGFKCLAMLADFRELLIELLAIDLGVIRPFVELGGQLVRAVSGQLHLVKRLYQQFTGAAART